MNVAMRCRGFLRVLWGCALSCCVALVHQQANKKPLNGGLMYSLGLALDYFGLLAANVLSFHDHHSSYPNRLMYR